MSNSLPDLWLFYITRYCIHVLFSTLNKSICMQNLQSFKLLCTNKINSSKKRKIAFNICRRVSNLPKAPKSMNKVFGRGQHLRVDPRGYDATIDIFLRPTYLICGQTRSSVQSGYQPQRAKPSRPCCQTMIRRLYQRKAEGKREIRSWQWGRETEWTCEQTDRLYWSRSMEHNIWTALVCSG